MKFYIQFVLFFISGFLFSQNTVGVTTYETGVQEGYTFFSNFNGTNAYLIDNCGRLTNKWERGTRPGLAAYFLDNGYMFRTYKPQVVGPFTSASNSGGVELVDWNNNTVWKYELNTATQLSHHDAVFMPNGNVLMLTWELEYTDDLIEWGRNPSEIAPQGFMWSEKIIEVEPVGSEGGNIIWEWNIKDHYIQDFDSSKQNFGVVSDHPEKFDINEPDINSSNSNASRDWNHFNAIDYNESLDQILISTRNSDEIWIIDHSTTTEEAASNSGGRYNNGGDILYRWGNPRAYKRGTTNDQQLFGQHGVHWIKEGLENEGAIMIFNNGNGRPGQDYSRAEILYPPQDSLGFYSQSISESFGPSEIDWEYGQANDERFYSAYLSNAQRLPNGNTLINNGSNGICFEINSSKEIVWEYVVPLSGNSPFIQGQNANGNGATFRMYKYPIDYPGFEEIDLTPGIVIEVDSNPEPCPIISTTEEHSDNSRLYFDIDSQLIKVDLLNSKEAKLNVYNIDGQPLISQNINTANTNEVSVSNLHSGIIFIELILDDSRIVTKGYVR